MTKAWVVLCCFAMMLQSTSALAESSGVPEVSVKLDQKAAAVAAWDFARCAVRKRPEEVRAILKVKLETADPEGDAKARILLLQKLAKRRGDCLAPGDSLKSGPQLFYDFLGGASFLMKYADRPLPDYSEGEKVVTIDDVKNAPAGVKRTDMVFRVFGECVFRLNPDGVKTLIMSRPFSQQEDAAFAQIQAVMGECIPFQEGMQAKLSKLLVREYLSMAAYLVDEFYELSKKKRAETVTDKQGLLYA
ncbi:hypothetical protein [Sphingobium sp. ZW T5_29]|uniref:hypothetical protein n=1 Tax=Sphingobium sp. ZW T5_29 TaxID=3378077 RepID=UPI003853839E